MIKKLFFSLTIGLAVHAVAFSGECAKEEEAIAMPSFKDRFHYVKLGGAFFAMPDAAFGPAVALGCRFEENRYALDISANYAGKGNQFMVTLPKALYLCYLDHEAPKGFYVGAGASFGWINQRAHKKNFAGLLTEMSAGYDFNRFGKAKMFIEATLSQPFLPVTAKHNPSFSPVFTLMYGIGF
ncbi:MAG TPA: hypothetical protein PLC42_00955 [Parachlamydiaceae bacterium]|nr:hypothetical protein [Parachlamydiaceae bacterium]